MPLREERLMRDAAHHVSAMKLTVDDTRTYVAVLRTDQGKPPAPRLTPARWLKRVKRAQAGLVPANGKRGLEKLAADATKEERAELMQALRDLMAQAKSLSDMLRKKA